MTVPCGRCIGCRLERSRQWAIRMMHESVMHEANSFLTLTYDDEHLPVDGSLVRPHFQDFMKRLRSHLAPHRVRYYMCGEYGDQTHRPHYHAVLFGHDFLSDRVFYSGEAEKRLYISPKLNELWGHGFCTIGEVTFESAAYVARYVMKKVTGEKAAEHYEVCNPETGLITQVEPEYSTMSLKPGIGQAWYDRYRDEVFPNDYVIIRGRKMRPPRYYDTLYERSSKSALEGVKQSRRVKGKAYAHDNTTDRLRAKEAVKRAQLGTLRRRVQ